MSVSRSIPSKWKLKAQELLEALSPTGNPTSASCIHFVRPAAAPSMLVNFIFVVSTARRRQPSNCFCRQFSRKSHRPRHPSRRAQSFAIPHLFPPFLLSCCSSLSSDRKLRPPTCDPDCESQITPPSSTSTSPASPRLDNTTHQSRSASLRLATTC